MNRKASLNLSIEAIVIVVIAFTVLGLGLGFVKSQIGDIQTTSSAVQEQISQQILDDLRTGNKRLSFPTQEVKLGAGDSEVLAIGVKNTLDSQIDIKILVQRQSGSTFSSLIPTSAGGTPTSGNFFWDDSIQTLDPGESRVFNLKYFSETKTGTYLYKVIVVYSSDPTTGISSDPATAILRQTYDSKSFFTTTT